MNQTNFIVLEGIDGAGKSTQVELLKTYFGARDVSVEYIHFPRLDVQPFGTLVGAFLRGDFGPIDQVDPKLVALLYAEDRHDFADTLRGWQREKKLILADRYVYSNVAFQCAKCSDPDERQQLKQWILDLEFEYFGIPRPSMSFFLYLDTSVAADAMKHDSTRSERTYLDGSKDIHEEDLGFQEKVRKEYLRLTESEQNFHLISCNDTDGQRHAPEYTHQQIIGFLNQDDTT
jgi:dTMP kinase